MIIEFLCDFCKTTFYCADASRVERCCYCGSTSEVNEVKKVEIKEEK